MRRRAPVQLCIALEHGNVPSDLLLSALLEIPRMTDRKPLIPIDNDPLSPIIAHKLLMDQPFVMQPRSAENTRTHDTLRISQRIFRHVIPQRNHHEIGIIMLLHHLQNCAAYVLGMKEKFVRIQKDDNLSCSLFECVVACKRKIILPREFIETCPELCRRRYYSRVPRRRYDNNLIDCGPKRGK